MNCWAAAYDGTTFSLPTVTSWEFHYGLGSPCDSFEVVCLWNPGDEKILAKASRFFAEFNGSRVFTGVVDEYSCVRDERGGRLELSGRGLQALLLDNEAIPVEYQWATAQDILRRHVSPYGIDCHQVLPAGAVPGFSVSSGQSEWSVILNFARSNIGIVPRFDRYGTLSLAPWDDSLQRNIGDTAPVSALRYRCRRYGVLSQVVVHNKNGFITQVVNDDDFQAQGGCCRRVLSVPGSAVAPAPRYSGEYQLRASRTERLSCELVLAQPFPAWPGELVNVAWSGFDGNGLYRVRDCTVKLDQSGLSSKLLLGPTDLLI